MFGKRLKELRIIANMKQKDVAKLLNVSPSTIGMYEQGRRDPDTETVIFIANYFGVTTDFLLGKVDEQKQDPPFFDKLVLAAPDLGEAIKISIVFRDEYDLSQEWLYGIWDKATTKFGIPGKVKNSGPAAHTRNTPGSGIKLDD